MNYTTHYKLQKDLTIEKYDVNVVNMNSDIIDSALHRLDIKDQAQDNLLATKETLNSEISRATTKEAEISEDLNSEIIRAKEVENNLSSNISEESNRAIMAENLIQESLSTHNADKANPHKVTPEQLNLGKVDNTADMDKPVSTAQQNAINQSTSDHNTSASAHDDIRNLISKLTTRLNTLADSDDITLDQLSEIVAYIKNNKDLIDQITTSKVNISDIVDDLISTSIDKPLSANQGRVLKDLISSLTKEDFGLGNVENKSSEDIRNDITYDNIVKALGYNPLGQSGIGEMRFEIDENYNLILIAPDGYDPPLELGDDGNLYYLFS